MPPQVKKENVNHYRLIEELFPPLFLGKKKLRTINGRLNNNT